MSIGPYVTCILETFLHPALTDWVMAYLPLQYFKLANEKPAYQDSSKSPSMSIGPYVTHNVETLPHPVLRGCVRTYLPLQYFKSANEELVYQVS
ncbi:hypothetical protein AVEN_55756-1 [Araneus ventricosus]|uniref:Uncharacterized protein n=1 Tax=Araneus ventricosus TaxID=182803 RepID=A0A4Y2JY63_ARAVE|nr:hypothetical protein AVEN_55756-1 [Araneus ventricosus]